MTEPKLVREVAQPLSGSANDYDALLELIGDARLVLVSEASHGTHEFYFERATAERKNVRHALRGSYEELFHQTGLPRFWIDLRGAGGQTSILQGPRLERAIGVIYRPETERLSHYVQLPKQFDAIVHIDETSAVEPVERTSIWDLGELPETYPFKV